MNTIKGKALLVITRVDSKWVPFEVMAFIQSVSGEEDDSLVALEDFELLATDSLPLPNAAYKLNVGETVRVAVVYEFSYYVDYWGEGDIQLEYYKQRVLRKQKARKIYLGKSK